MLFVSLFETFYVYLYFLVLAYLPSIHLPMFFSLLFESFFAYFYFIVLAYLQSVHLLMLFFQSLNLFLPISFS